MRNERTFDALVAARRSALSAHLAALRAVDDLATRKERAKRLLAMPIYPFNLQAR